MPALLNRYQIRLNLINLMIEIVHTAYRDSTANEGQSDFLRLLEIYRMDTIRQMQGRHGSLDYLFDTLKVGVRLANDLMDRVQEDESQSLIGWYHGVTPTNMVQHVYNVLSETALELSASIMEIESFYPMYKAMFDREREDYRRIHEQWRKEDEAERV